MQIFTSCSVFCFWAKCENLKYLFFFIDVYAFKSSIGKFLYIIIISVVSAKWNTVVLIIYLNDEIVKFSRTDKYYKTYSKHIMRNGSKSSIRFFTRKRTLVDVRFVKLLLMCRKSIYCANAGKKVTSKIKKN